MRLAKVKVAACVVGVMLTAGAAMVALAGSGSVAKSSGGAVVSAPAAKAASWPEEMKQTYGLAEGEMVRRVKPPYSAARTSYWRSVGHRQPGDATPPPDQIMFEWGSEFTPPSMGWGAVDPLGGVLATVMGWSSGDFEIAPELRAKRVPGDWVIRAGATEQQKLDALVAILRRDVDPAITIEKRANERGVVVARGQFEYQPHVDASGGNQVLLYSDPYVAEEGGGGGAGSLDEFLKTMGNCAGVQVVNEVKGNRPEMVSWHTLSSCWVSQMPKGANRDGKLDSLLRNVAAQTGLSLIREKKQTGVWVVGRKAEGKR